MGEYNAEFNDLEPSEANYLDALANEGDLPDDLDRLEDALIRALQAIGPVRHETDSTVATPESLPTRHGRRYSFNDFFESMIPMTVDRLQVKIISKGQ